jgi:lipopolysaccharide transport system permease protein
VNFLDLWTYRELLYFLIWRDLKVRYKQTALGVAWVVLQPLLTTLIFTVVFGRLTRVPTDGVPYPVFAFTGLLVWNFFNSALMSGSNSLVGNANILTKVYFPRVIVPSAAIGGRLIDFAVAFVILVVLMFFYAIPVTLSMLWLPALVALVTVLALGMGMWAAALNVRYRDVGTALPVLIQLWMFASPVFYPASIVPERWQRLYSLNPMVGVIEGFRNAMFGRGMDWPSLAVSVACATAFLLYGAYTFRRVERVFADVV